MMYPRLTRKDVSIGRVRMLSSCCQMSVLSLVIVTLGIGHAEAGGVADGAADLEGNGLVEGASELSLSEEALTGSTMS